MLSPTFTAVSGIRAAWLSCLQVRDCCGPSSHHREEPVSATLKPPGFTTSRIGRNPSVLTASTGAIFLPLRASPPRGTLSRIFASTTRYRKSVYRMLRNISGMADVLISTNVNMPANALMCCCCSVEPEEHAGGGASRPAAHAAGQHADRGGRRRPREGRRRGGGGQRVGGGVGRPRTARQRHRALRLPRQTRADPPDLPPRAREVRTGKSAEPLNNARSPAASVMSLLILD